MQASDYLAEMDRAEHDVALCTALLERLAHVLDGRPMRFMEVCGTHTVSIFQSGLRSMLPANVIHISGPGCPVCVTHEAEIALLMELAERSDVLIATFGDLMRVPDNNGLSLKHKRAAGANIEIIYSPLHALEMAQKNPDKEVIFPGIGFETTAPGIAATIIAARKGGVRNFSVLSCHKLVPPALASLLQEGPSSLDALLLPGHVATITGVEPFAFLADEFGKPAAIGGFEPVDLLLALCELAEQCRDGKPQVANVYKRAVDDGGNPRALALMKEVFETGGALWRGLGEVEASGLRIAKSYEEFDAFSRFGLSLPQAVPISGCACGQILKGQLEPDKCPMFGKRCTPASPIGPCMVSTEGSCAAWYKYGLGKAN